MPFPMFAVALLCLGLVAARTSCPLYYGSYSDEMFVHPSPALDISYNAADKNLSIAVSVAYDPTAAIVIAMEPFGADRKTLSETGLCENRDASTADWTWKLGPYSGCELGDANMMWPAKGGKWQRSVDDCNIVTYTYTTTLADLFAECSSEYMGVKDVKGKASHFGNIFVTYVRPAVNYTSEGVDNGMQSLLRDEHQVTFFIDDEVTVDVSSSCSDATVSGFSTKASVEWWSNKIQLNVTTSAPQPTGRLGLLCSLQAVYRGTEEMDVLLAQKECMCDIHCRTSAFCTTATGTTCDQTWTLQAPGTRYPGSLDGGVFTLQWDINNCAGFQLGMSACPSRPEKTYKSVLTLHEHISAHFEYAAPLTPFAALLLRQPPDKRFDYSFTDKDLKVWVRVFPFANGVLNASKVDFCEAQRGTLECKSTWALLGSWADLPKTSVAEASVVLPSPKDKVYVFRVFNTTDETRALRLVLDTSESDGTREAPMPSAYISQNRVGCGNGGMGQPGEEAAEDGFAVRGVGAFCLLTALLMLLLVQ